LKIVLYSNSIIIYDVETAPHLPMTQLGEIVRSFECTPHQLGFPCKDSQ